MFEGIPTYRFVAPSTLFANGSVYAPNEGFCPCLESGIQNISTCRFSTCRLRWEGSGGRVGICPCLVCRISGLFTLHNPIRPERRQQRESEMKKIMPCRSVAVVRKAHILSGLAM